MSQARPEERGDACRVSDYEMPTLVKGVKKAGMHIWSAVAGLCREEINVRNA